MATILIVDDEVGVRELLSDVLRDEGYSVVLAESAEAARKRRIAIKPDLILLDIWMPDMDGVSLLKEWVRLGLLSMPVIMMSGHASIETAVEATKMGAIDFLEKPISLKKLLFSVQAALAKVTSQHAASASQTLDMFQLTPSYHELAKRLANMKSEQIFLLSGAPGGPYALCANTLHRPGTPWLREEALAQPNASVSLKQAHGGLLFISNLVSLEPSARDALCSLILEADQHHLRLVLAYPSEVISQLNEIFPAAVSNRIACSVVFLPRFVDIPNEIPSLAQSLLNACANQLNVSARRFSEEVLTLLKTRAWTDDFEELNNLIVKLVRTVKKEEIGLSEMGDFLKLLKIKVVEEKSILQTAIDFDQPLRAARDAFESIYLSYHLKKEKGNMTRVAERVGMERTHLYRKLRSLGLMPRHRVLSEVAE